MLSYFWCALLYLPNGYIENFDDNIVYIYIMDQIYKQDGIKTEQNNFPTIVELKTIEISFCLFVGSLIRELNSSLSEINFKNAMELFSISKIWSISSFVQQKSA